MPINVLGLLTGTLSVNLAQSRLTLGEKPLGMSKGSFRVGFTGSPKFGWVALWHGLVMGVHLSQLLNCERK